MDIEDYLPSQQTIQKYKKKIQYIKGYIDFNIYILCKYYIDEYEDNITTQIKQYYDARCKQYWDILE